MDVQLTESPSRSPLPRLVEWLRNSAVMVSCHSCAIRKNYDIINVWRQQERKEGGTMQKNPPPLSPINLACILPSLPPLSSAPPTLHLSPSANLIRLIAIYFVHGPTPARFSVLSTESAQTLPVYGQGMDWYAKYC